MLKTHLLIWVTVFLNDSDPREHVLPPLCLEQILAVRGGETQHILAPRVAVGDVNQTGRDADLQRLLVGRRRSLRHGILPVFVEGQGVTLQDSIHRFPRPHSSTDALQRGETRDV